MLVFPPEQTALTPKYALPLLRQTATVANNLIILLENFGVIEPTTTELTHALPEEVPLVAPLVKVSCTTCPMPGVSVPALASSV